MHRTVFTHLLAHSAAGWPGIARRQPRPQEASQHHDQVGELLGIPSGFGMLRVLLFNNGISMRCWTNAACLNQRVGRHYRELARSGDSFAAGMAWCCSKHSASEHVLQGCKHMLNVRLLAAARASMHALRCAC